MTQIGQSTQYQPNIIQNSPQQNAQKTIQKQAQNEQKNSSPTSQNQNFQKIAQEILDKRSAIETFQKPAIERGQVINLLI